MDRDSAIRELVKSGALDVDFETGEVFSTRIRGNVITGKSWGDYDSKLDGNRLMQHQFPSRPNQPQHENEPSRLCGRIPNRSNRIKALGNAVVPQCVYPIFVNLYQRLAEGQSQ